MKRDSQLKTIKRHLLKGLSISSMEAIVKYHITRLAVFISLLNHSGYKISYYWDGEGQSKYKVYYIKDENL